MTLCVVCGCIAPAWGAPGNWLPVDVPYAGAASVQRDLITFDIPAQPLADALSRYALLSRQPALYDSDQAVGRTSFPVMGAYTAEAALHLLLTGTGLAARSAQTPAGKTFALAVAGNRSEAVPGSAADGELTPERRLPADAGLIQTRIAQAVCAQQLLTLAVLPDGPDVHPSCRSAPAERARD